MSPSWLAWPVFSAYDHVITEDVNDSSNQQSGDSEQAVSGSEQTGGSSQEQGRGGGDPAAGATC